MRLGIFSFTNCVLTPGRVSISDVDTGRLREYNTMYDKIVALGRFPSEVLTRLEIRHFMLPHPSGLNRQINDRKYIDARLDACVEYLDA